MKQKAKAKKSVARSPIIMTVAGVIGLGFLFILVFFIFHAAKTSIYSNRTDAKFEQASLEVNEALAKIGVTYSEASKTMCASASSSWYNFDKYCISKGQNGVVVLNAEMRKFFEKNVAKIEASLVKDGWKGNGWLKSLAYNIVRWPSTSTPSGFYTKVDDNSTCKFNFDSTYNITADTTTINTHVWCEYGKGAKIPLN